jgi:ABC-type transport system involved in multi-copper enzyme maturation permease subunit
MMKNRSREVKTSATSKTSETSTKTTLTGETSAIKKNIWGTYVIAKREFIAAIRSPRMLMLGIIVFLICFLSALLGTVILGGQQLPIGMNLPQFNIPGASFLTVELIAFLLGIAAPFMAAALSFDNITREKEIRSLPLLLSQPLSKRSIAFGKYIGISCVLALPIILSLAVSIVLIFLLTGESQIIPLGARLIAFTFLLSMSFVGIQQEVSTLVKTTRTSMIAGVGILFFFWVFWLIIWIAYAAWMFSSAGLAFNPTNIMMNYPNYTLASAIDVGFASTPLISYFYYVLFKPMNMDFYLSLIPYAGVKAIISLIGWIIAPALVFIETFNRTAGKE